MINYIPMWPVHRGLALVCGLLLTLCASAQWKDWDYELEQEKKPWQELQTKLPPYPKPENWLKFDIGANATNSFFIDTASLSVGDDGVVRYTVVIKTSGGATNVSFEGLRCDSRQLRVYAFGHPNAQWSRARNVSWREIEPRVVNGHHYVLFRDYFCASVNRKDAASVKQIIATLKSGPKYPAE